MKITQQEKEELEYISNNYKQVHSQLLELEEKINQIEKKKSDLLDQLQKLREREKTFKENLSHNYFENYQLNIETGEIEQLNENDSNIKQNS